MDFAWVVDALRRGLKVTREAWKQDPPVKYLYMLEDLLGNRAIMMCPNNGVRGSDLVWYPNADQLLYMTDWEEYVEPKKSASAKAMQEDLPVWPEVNADGYARMSKDSDVVIHDGVYRCKKAPSEQVMEDQSDYAKETRKVVDSLPEDYYKVQLIDALVDAFADKISQRVAQLLQKTGVPLSKKDTNHVRS